MKPNISEQLARIAITAAAAMCGAVFSMSTASAQTFSASVTLDKENLRITTEVTGAPATGFFYCCGVQQSEDNMRVGARVISSSTQLDGFISGAEGVGTRNVVGDIAVYNLSLILNASFDYSRPFLYFNYFGLKNTTPIRVAGITGGTVSIDKSGQLLSVNTSDLTNVVERAVIKEELTYKWETQAPGESTWTTDTAATLQTYTAADDLGVRVIVSDKAGMATDETVTAIVTPPLPLTFTTTLDKENLRVTISVTSTGGHTNLRCCLAEQDTGADEFDQSSNQIVQGGNLLPADNFISGASGMPTIKAGDIAVYNLSAVLNASFVYSLPFASFTFRQGDSQNYFPAPIRVAGITGGTVTLEKNLQVLSVNISGLTNVVGREVIPEELSFQWQTKTGGASFANAASNGTNQTYTLAANIEGRVIITDKAGLAAVQTVSLAAEVVTPPAEEGPLADNHVRLNFENQRVEGLPGQPQFAQFAIYETATMVVQGAITGGGLPFANIAQVSRGEGRTVYLPFAEIYSNSNFVFSHPFIGFYNSAGATSSNRVRIAGITGGTATVVASGAQYSVNVSGLTNVLSLLVRGAELSYQWQTQTLSATNDWTNVSLATMQTFPIPNQQQVRVKLTDRAGLDFAQTVTATPPRIAGEIAISFPALTLGTSVSVDLSGLRNSAGDAPSAGDFTFQWQTAITEGGEGADIPSASSSVYVLNNAELRTNQNNRFLRLVATSAGTPPLVFTANISLNAPLANVNAAVTFRPGPDGRYSPGAAYFLNESLLTDANGTFSVNKKIWYARNTVTDARRQIGKGKRNFLATGDVKPDEVLELFLESVDAFRFTSEIYHPLPFETSPAVGAVTFSGDNFSLDSIFRADVSNIRDENGIGVFQYVWEVNGTEAYAPLPVAFPPIKNPSRPHQKIPEGGLTIQTDPGWTAPVGSDVFVGNGRANFQIKADFSADLSKNAQKRNPDIRAVIRVFGSDYQSGEQYQYNYGFTQGGCRVERGSTESVFCAGEVKNIHTFSNDLLQGEGWNPEWVSLRLRVVHTDPYGGRTTLRSAPIALDKQPRGFPGLYASITDDGATVISVDISGISDENTSYQPKQSVFEINDEGEQVRVSENAPVLPGAGQFYYSWLDGRGEVLATGLVTTKAGVLPFNATQIIVPGGVFPVGAATMNVYRLTEENIAAIDDGQQLHMRLRYRDGLGFLSDWLIPMDYLRAQISIAADGRVVSSDLSGRATGVNYNYQWLQASVVRSSTRFVPLDQTDQYQPILDAENSPTLTLPADYDRAYSHVRLLAGATVRLTIVTFTTTTITLTPIGATQGVARVFVDRNSEVLTIVRAAISPPLLVAAITTGTVTIRQEGGLRPGARVVADISSFRDLFGKPLAADDLRYQWLSGVAPIPFGQDGGFVQQTFEDEFDCILRGFVTAPCTVRSPGSDSDWQNIALATSQAYVLRPGDISGERKYVQVLVSDKSGIVSRGVKYDSNVVDLNTPPSGSAAITFIPGNAAKNAVFAADTSGINNPNGLGEFAYQWVVRRSGSVNRFIPAGTGETYTLVAEDLPLNDGIMPFLDSGDSMWVQLLVSLRGDTFGFANDTIFIADSTISVARTFESPTLAILTGDTLGRDDVLEADISALDVDAGYGYGPNADGVSYRWFGKDASGGGEREISGVTGSTFTLTTGWDLQNVAVEMRPDFTDIFGRLFSTLYAGATYPLAAVSVETSGNGRVVVIAEDGMFGAGATLSLSAEELFDVNNNAANAGAVSAISWGLRGGTPTDGETYTVTDADVSDGGIIEASFTYTDGLGYSLTLTAELNSVIFAQLQLPAPENSIVTTRLMDPLNVMASTTPTFQWYQGGRGGFEAISGATSSNYIAPQSSASFDPARPFLVVSVDYQLNTEAGGGMTFAMSPPLRFRGVPAIKRTSGGGDNTILGLDAAPELPVGTERTALFRNLENILGFALVSNELRYQWQKSEAYNTHPYVDIPGATLATYLVDSAEIDADAPFLRVVGYDRASLYLGPLTQDGGGENIDRGTGINNSFSGTLSIVVTDSGAFSGNVNRFIDRNGLGTLTYRWLLTRDGEQRQITAGLVEFTGQTDYVAATALQSYTPAAGDVAAFLAEFPNTSGNFSVVLSVSHTDPFRFEQAFSSTMEISEQATSGAPALRVDGYSPGDFLQADVSAVTDGNGIGSFIYQWQGGVTSSISGGDWQNLNAGTDARYTVPIPVVAAWNTLIVSVRFVASHIDPFGETSTLAPQATQFAQPTEGDANIIVGFDNRGIVEGTQLEVDLNQLTDANGIGGRAGAVAYQWLNADDSVKEGETAPTYILTSVDIAATSGPRLSLLYADALGYQTPMQATSELVAVFIEQNEATLQLNVDDPQNAAASGRAIQWQQGPRNATDADYVDISGQTGQTYTVPENSMPFVRARFAYTSGSAQRTIFAQPVIVMTGVDLTGDASFTLAGVGVGDLARLDISNLSRFLGGAPLPGDLTYQWQTGTSQFPGHAEWASIAGATLVNYALATADFITSPLPVFQTARAFTGNPRVFLRVIITDVATERTRLLVGQGVNRQTGGRANITYGAAGSLNLFTEGLVFTANVDGITDENGLDEFRYQWNIKVNNSQSFVSFPGMTDRVFTLSRSDFQGAFENDSIPLLGVDVWQRDVFGYTEFSRNSRGAIITLESARPQGLRITPPAVNYGPGGVFTANTVNITDANGNGTVVAGSYQWKYANADGASTIIASRAQTDSYTLVAAEWDTNYSHIILAARYEDAGGNVQDLISQSELVNQPTRGAVTLAGEAPAGSTLTAVANLTDGNGIGTITYQWFDGNGATLTGATSSTYVVTEADIATGRLRVSVTFMDAIGFSTPFSAEFNFVDYPTTGGVTIVGETTAGATLTAIANITDGNGTRSITYQWFRGTDTTPTTVTSSTYVVTEADIDSGQLRVSVTFVDGIGSSTLFSAIFSFSIDTPERQAEHLRKIAGIFDRLEGAMALDAVGTHLDTHTAAGNGAAGSFAEINNVRFNGKEDLAHALARRTESSLNTDKQFALDSFAFRIYGGGNSGDGNSGDNFGGGGNFAANAGNAANAGEGGGPAWSAWAHGGWLGAEGSFDQLLRDETNHNFAYDGDAFALYGGYDRKFGNGLLAGLAAGRTDVDLHMDLTELTHTGTMARKGKVQRQMNSLLQYVEWRGTEGHARLIGGFALGDLQITDDGACNASADVNWRLLAGSTEYALLSTRTWGAALVGEAHYTNSDTDALTCVNTEGDNAGKEVNLPEVTASGGEWLVGGRVYYNGATHGHTFAPRIGIDARRPFGDLKDDLAYDLVGDLSFGAVLGDGLSFRLEGKTQLNDTAHQRDALSGRLDYARGAFRSSLQTNAQLEGGERRGLSHRWELGYAGIWGANTLGGNLYVERQHSGEGATNVGAEILFDF